VTICGHERDVLVWALELRAKTDTGGIMMYSAGTEREKSRRVDAYFDVDDPAKLSAMLAERGRELGLAFWHGPNEPREPSPTDYVLYVLDGVIRLYSPLGPKAWQRQRTMPQARTILLQWLQLPDGAHEEAEQALRGES